MKYSIISFLLAVVTFSSAVVFASEEASYSGNMTLQGRTVNQEGESAYLNKYMDISDGLYGSFWGDYYKGKQFVELYGTNVSLDDQSYGLRVGKYESFKLHFLYDETPIKVSLGSRAFYNGIGSDTLTYNATDREKNTDLVLTPNITSDWNEFDYEMKRRKSELGLDLSLNSPYFFRIKLNEHKKEGTIPIGMASNVFPDITSMMISEFGNIIEMPAPVDFTTHNSILDTGYRSEGLNIKLSGMYSKFTNDNETLAWRNPYVTTDELNDTISLAPDNDYYKISSQVSIKLPRNSVLAMRGGYSLGTSESVIVDSIPTSTDGVGPPLAPPISSPVYGVFDVNSADFEGKKEDINASVMFGSCPTDKIDLNFYYRYLDRNNTSNNMIFSLPLPDDPTTTQTVENVRYNYTKQNAGLELGFRMPLETKANVGYDFAEIDRDELLIAESTTDHEVWFELLGRNLGAFDWKVRYTHLERLSDFGLGNAGTDLYDPVSIYRFIRYYNSTDKSRDDVKLEFNFPVGGKVDAAVWYRYSIDDYADTILGKTNEDNHEVYLDASWVLPGNICLRGFIGYERRSAETKKRYIDELPLGDPVNTDPSSGTIEIYDPVVDSILGRDITAYNWSYKQINDYWDFSITGEAPILRDKLNLLVSGRYQIQDAKVNFKSDGSEPLEDIEHVDDYTLYQIDTILTYTATEIWKIFLGYTYQKFEYDDVQIDGYEYVSTDTNNNRYFLTGANTDAEQENNIFCLGISYQL